MFLVAEIKEACGKPRCLNSLAVYDNHKENSTKKKERNSPTSNDASLSPLPPFGELCKCLVIGFSPPWCFHFLLQPSLFSVTHIT